MVLDIGIGVLSSIFISWRFGVAFDWHIVLWGIGFALAPDLDYLFYLFRKGKRDGTGFRHREIFLHWPIPYLTLGTLLLWQWGLPWITLFWICSVVHFLHDSIGMGYGIQWLQPFYKHRFEFFYSFRPPEVPKAPIKALHVWAPEEIDRLQATVGDPGYLENMYLRLHPFAVAEFVVAYLSLAVLYLYLT